MANFENPLDRFHTYSYYHILVACTTTDVAESIKTSTFLNLGRRTQSIEEKYKVRGITADGKEIDKDHPNRIGRYSILFNGSTDAEFSITNVKWNTVLYPVNDENAYTTIATEGKMEIQEPRGARFLNLINNVVHEFGISAESVIFSIKTIFVGRTNTGTAVKTEDITNIPPLMFTLYDLTAEFDMVGSTYEVTFVPLSNGAAKMSQYNLATNQITSFNLNAKSSLVSALDLFSQKINTIYGDYAKDVVKQSGKKESDFTFMVYSITYDDIYRDETRYKIDNFEDQTKTTLDGEIPISFGDDATIESALNKIMKHCTGVIADGNGESKHNNNNKKDNIKYGYKILSSVQSFASTNKDSKEETVNVVVNYRIVRYALPTQSIIELAFTGDETSELLKNNSLILNYIWTGKNKDILEFDMRLAAGVAFLQLLTTTNNIPKDNSDPTKASKAQLPSARGGTLLGQNSSTENPNKKSKSNEQNKTQKTLLTFPSNDKNNDTRNTKKPYSSLTFNNLLGRFAALEGMDTSVKIRGNPIFFSNFINTPSIFNNPELSTKDGHFSDFERVPSLCKINIKMPRADVFPGVNDNNITSYEDFWYKGYYYIYYVENIFEGSGEFTQVLKMTTLPNDLDFSNDEDTNVPTTAVSSLTNAFSSDDWTECAVKDLLDNGRQE